MQTHFIGKSGFLVADTQLYKRLCLSIGPVGPFIKIVKRAFLFVIVCVFVCVCVLLKYLMTCTFKDKNIRYVSIINSSRLGSVKPLLTS